MLRRAARWALVALFAAALLSMAQTARTLYRNPLLQPLVERGQDQIAGAMDRQMARTATPDRITARLRTLLDAPRRNWLAITAVEEAASERSVALPPDLQARRAAAWDDDHEILAGTGACAACAFDPGQCRLDATLLCQTPMLLTPLGDIAGLALEGGHCLTGQQVDRINLTLSLVGLGAVAAGVLSAGSSLTVKAGASTAKLARSMKLVSPGLTRLMLGAARDGIDWAALPAARGAGDLNRVLRPAAIGPLSETLRHIGRVGDTLGPTRTLHMVRYIDGPDDARRIANASEALGAKTVGRMEVLGKSRFLRATMRLSRLAWELMAAVLTLLFCAVALLGAPLKRALRRGLVRVAQR